MAAAPQKTGVPQSAGNSAESASAISQVASSVEAANVAGDSPAADEQLAKAWGFSGRRPKLSREALIGVACIVALLGLFAVVIVKNWKNRANVVAKDDPKKDKDVKPAGGTDAFALKTPVEKTNFQDTESDQDSAKNESDDINLDDVGKSQDEPAPKRVALKTNDLELEQDQVSSPSFEEEPPARTARKNFAVTETDLDLNQEPAESPAKKSRVTVSQDIDLDDTPVKQNVIVQNEPNIDEPLTKTREPKRFEEPVVREQPRDEQFKEPIRVNASKLVQDEIEEAPKQVAKKPARSPKVDHFDEERVAVASDNAERRVSPTTDLPAPTGGGKKHHPLLKQNEFLVEKGDNFCTISKKVYGDDKYYRALAEHNRDRVADPCRMYPGLIVIAPPRETLEQQHAALIPKPKVQMEAKGDQPRAAKKVTALPPGIFLDDKGNTWYRVGKGDTISEIAQDYLGRESRRAQIVTLNRESLTDPNNLRLGQELRLPNDASRVRIAGKEPATR